MPLPTLVRVLPPLIAPLKVRLPASRPMLEAALSETVFVAVLSPLMFRSAPPEEMPVPFSTRGSGEVMPPVNSSAAPSLTVVLPAPVPRAALFEIRRLPALIVVAPL